MCSKMSRLTNTPNEDTRAVLSIAGSDSSGGAGIQADIKTLSALGVFATTAITSITAQNTQGVYDIHEVPADSVARQISSVLDDIDIAAIKIGLVPSVNIMSAVAESLRHYTRAIVLDPVMVAKSGDMLLQPEAVFTFRETLLPLVTVITPNLPEVAALLGQSEAENLKDAEQQGRSLLEMGAKNVLIKGGHFHDEEDCIDLLLRPDLPTETFRATRIDTQNTHGTGCTLSSAIAAYIARGYDLSDAIDKAKGYLHRAISLADTLTIGHGCGPVHHFFEQWG